MTDVLLWVQLFILVFTLTIIAIVDLKTKTIPDSALVVLAVAGLGFQWFGTMSSAAILSAAFYFCCFWLVRKVHKIATGRIGLGFGDVKMAGAAGAWISIGAAPLFIGLAAVAALMAVAVASLAGGAALLKQRIPFGPFLALSLLVCWMLRVSNIDLDGFYDLLSFA